MDDYRMALAEFALGMESLARFVNKEPLYQVHTCASPSSPWRVSRWIRGCEAWRDSAKLTIIVDA